MGFNRNISATGSLFDSLFEQFANENTNVIRAHEAEHTFMHP